MDGLVGLVIRLREVFRSGDVGDVALPQVAVVGTQSAGKSSVLEHLVGRSFLPRGAGVVTRCPLELRLVHSDKPQEYAIFSHQETRVLTDYRLVRREIERQTERLAGSDKGICHTPIQLSVYSPSVVDLTLVDLPGLTRVPVGDQPADIEEQTRSLIMRYVVSPECIILAVTPGNADIATSESLKIARQVDPAGARTLAVVTKLDLMDEGTDAWQVLSGRVIPVRLGIVGVVNRSQKDIEDDKSIEQSLKDEEEFFKKKYKSIASTNGSSYLKKMVQALLIGHIKNCIPKVKDRIEKKLATKRSELIKLGDGQQDKPGFLLDLMTRFSFKFTSAIKGNQTNIQTKELFGGARIKYVFQECLSTALKSIDALVGLTKTDILTAMENASGVSHTIFVSEVAFELLVRRQIERVRDPCLQCVGLILQELQRLASSCLEDQDLQLGRFPRLRNELDDLLNDLLLSRLPVTNQMVHHFIDSQLAYINTAHPDFLSNFGRGLSLSTVADKNILVTRHKSMTTLKPPEDSSIPPPHCDQDKGSRDCTLIQELIRSYFSIVRKTTQDMIPKIVMNFMVNFVVDHLQMELVARLYKMDAQDLLRESQDTVEKRREVQTEIRALEQAVFIISGLPTSARGKGDSPALQQCCVGHRPEL